MKIGLYDMDGHNFPNLPLMKLSAWHKKKGDTVEWINHLDHYDKVYVTKVFSNEYSPEDRTYIDADEIVYGGTGFAITVEDGKEVYRKDRDKDLPYEIEHIYPDYSIYPELTKDTAYGFLTRGCCNQCSFCIVSPKEGTCSHKVADLSEWWNGQKHIKLLDANILACRDRIELLKQLRDSGATVDFTQGLDARFITKEIALLLREIKKSDVHFAFDFMRNENAIIKGLKVYAETNKVTLSNGHNSVYILTNYDTTIEEDLYRINAVKELGYAPYVMIYRKKVSTQITRDLQRWANNRALLHACDFMDYVPRRDGKTIKELYFRR